MFKVSSWVSIKLRLGALGGAILFFLCLLSFSGWQGMETINRRNGVVSGLEQGNVALQAVVRGLAEFVISENTPQSRKLIATSMATFAERINALPLEMRHEGFRRQLQQDIVPPWLVLKAEVEVFMALPRVSIDNVPAMIKYGQISVLAEELIAKVEGLAQAEAAYAEATVAWVTRAMGLLSFFILLLSTLMLWSVYRSVAAPIAAMAMTARRTAEGDLNHSMELTGVDEIGLLAESFRTMTGSLRGMIGRIGEVTGSISKLTTLVSGSSAQVLEAVGVQRGAIEKTGTAISLLDEAVGTLAAHAEDLSETAQFASAEVRQLNTSTRQLAEQSDAYNQVAEKAAASVSQMIFSSRGVAASIDILSNAFEQASSALLEVDAAIEAIQQRADESVRLAAQVSTEAAEQGLPAVQAAVAGMTEIKQRVGTLAEGIERLGVRSEEIGRILAVIDEIADQTSLLALNAAILAAQAGEHGLGFGVVAREIKSLAARTSLSTKEIDQLVSAVQAEVKTSITLADQGIRAVDAGVEQVQGVSRVFQSIHASALASTEKALEINETTIAQTRVIHGVSTNILSMNEQVGNISLETQKQGQGSQLILETVEKSRDLAGEITLATQQQFAAGRQLTEVAEGLSRRAEQIKLALGEQRQRSAEVGGAILRIGETTRELKASVSHVDQSTRALRLDAETLTDEVKKFRL